MTEAKHLTLAELEAGLDTIRQSPKNEGVLTLIVRRPQIDQRETLQTGELDQVEGLVGDTWRTRGSNRTADGSSHLDMQLTIINSRVLALIAQARERWPMAGDQLAVDLDLSVENLPPGTRLSLGSAMIQITSQPHTGCDKFSARFGRETLQWVTSTTGKQLRLRGLNSRVVRGGVIHIGDVVTKV